MKKFLLFTLPIALSISVSFAAEVEQTHILQLLDGTKFEVKPPFINACETLKHMVTDCGQDHLEPIPILEASVTLEVLEILKNLIASKNNPDTLKNLSPGQLGKLLVAADYFMLNNKGPQ